MHKKVLKNSTVTNLDIPEKDKNKPPLRRSLRIKNKKQAKQLINSSTVINNNCKNTKKTNKNWNYQKKTKVLRHQTCVKMLVVAIKGKCEIKSL